MEFVRRLWSWLSREAHARELQEEMELHLEMKAQEYTARGASPEHARRRHYSISATRASRRRGAANDGGSRNWTISAAT